MDADLSGQRSTLSRRMIRDVVRPFLEEHQMGLHGRSDAAAVMTVVLCALAKAMVPTLVAATDIAGQQAMLDAMVGLINEEAAGFRAHVALKAAAQAGRVH